MRLLTAGLVLTITLIAFSALAVETILPLVSDDLGGVSLYGWVFSAFFLASLASVIVAGGVADERGTLAPYSVGLALFVIGLAIAGAAPAMPVVVAGRLVQGTGSGAILAATYASIARAYSEAQRPRIFAIISTAWVLPAIVGPAAAAFIATAFGWRTVFFSVLPFAVVAALLAVPALRRLGPPAQHGERTSRRDAVFVAIGGGLVLAGLSNPTPALAFALLGAGVAVGVPALRRVTPPGTLAGRAGLGAAVLVRGLLTFAFFGTEAFLPLMLREARGLSPTLAGVVLTTGGVTWTAGSWVHERLAPRLTSRRIITTAFALVALGAFGVLAVLLVPALPVELAYVAWATSGGGIGFGYAAISVLVLRLAPPGRTGATGASMQVLDNLGTALGTGAGGAAVAIAVANGLPVETGIAAAFVVAIAGGLAGLAVSRRLDASRPSVVAVTPVELGPLGEPSR
ncbi:MAG TPA: MFS transporter [Candidatus Limnocylindria bacterium]|nr:MFS transporter [Candidatus Limnocylindria bacterium]